MHRSRSGFAALLCLIGPISANAQQSNPELKEDREIQDVVVEASSVALRKAEEARIRIFVDSITTKFEGKLAVLRSPLCVGVLGLTEPTSAFIVRRIEEIARKAKAVVPKKRCDINFLVWVTPNAHQIVRKATDIRSAVFDGMQVGDLNRLAKSPGPVWSWSGTQIVDAFTQVGLPLFSLGASNASASSRIQTAIRYDISAAIVVIDAAAVVGKTPTQIADYAAVRALARAVVPRMATSIPTILTLFDANSAAPLELSDVDRALLRGVYLTDGRRDADADRSLIARTIIKDVLP